MKIVIDIETTWQMVNGRRYPLPFDSRNKFVTFQYLKEDGSKAVIVLDHKDKTVNDASICRDYIQAILNEATLLIGHNIKFDVMWLRECGFVVSAPLYDTMISEYIRAKGLKLDLSLKGSALRRGLTQKLDILAEYMDKGINTDEIPLKELCEYALGDCVTTWELYEWQQNNPLEGTANVEQMMNEFVDVLITMERNGTCIDLEKLDEIQTEYETEFRILEALLHEQVRDVMGDTPFNLASGEQLSQVIYSRKVQNKTVWKELFNIGTELRNSVYKKKRPPRMSNNAFRAIILEHTDKVYRTTQYICESCHGKGAIRKIKKNGEEFKKDNICTACSGTGFWYVNTDKVAGFKITPKDVMYISDGGFSTNKKLLVLLMADSNISDKAKEFLKNYMRYGAISTYLTSFVDGIKNNVKGENLLHVNFNQCITATGRLSSSNPNFQNLPRDKQFPIRQTIKSRWLGGTILDCDLAQLEFRVAAILANDARAKQDILKGVDVHSYTSKVLTDAGQPTDRQDAKSHTFKPLYGGLSGTKAEVAYYTAFLEKYTGIAAWHEKLSDEAIEFKEIKSPSGRIYAFPSATRQRNGKSSQFTQIVNYCVQGFATGDITPCIMIEIQKEIIKQGLKSLIILTVHDSVTADIYPGEEERMIKLFKKVFDNIPEILYNRFSIKLDIPIGYELKTGINWSNTRKVA